MMTAFSEHGLRSSAVSRGATLDDRPSWARSETRLDHVQPPMPATDTDTIDDHGTGHDSDDVSSRCCYFMVCVEALLTHCFSHIRPM